MEDLLYVVEAYKEMGNELFARDQLLDAINYYNKALTKIREYEDWKSDDFLVSEDFDHKISAPLIKLYNNLCVCHLRLNKLEDALEYADEVIDLDQTNVKAHFNRGKCL